MKNVLVENERFREQYFQSIKSYVENLQEKFSYSQLNTVKDIVGYPLNLLRSMPKLLLKEKCLENEKYILYRVQLESFLGIRVFGLMSEPKIKQKSNTAIIFQHGGGDSPEITFGLIEDSVYKATADYISQKGITVFAPQLLLWNKSEYGTTFEREDRHTFDRKLKEHGGSITALEIHVLQTIADYLGEFELCTQLAVSGMSYGGMYALFSTAIDKRFVACHSSSWFNDRQKYNWTDWTYSKFLSDYQVVAEILPRKVFIEVGKHDEMFDVDSSIKEYGKLNENNFAHHCVYNIYDGGHEINLDRTIIDAFVNYVLEKSNHL